MSEVQLVELAISKKHPDFLTGHHRLYAGACVRRHRVLRGRVSPFQVFDRRTGVLLPGPIEVVTLDYMFHPKGAAWGASDGTCWIHTENRRPDEVSLHCIRA